MSVSLIGGMTDVVPVFLQCSGRRTLLYFELISLGQLAHGSFNPDYHWMVMVTTHIYNLQHITQYDNQ